MKTVKEIWVRILGIMDVITMQLSASQTEIALRDHVKESCFYVK